MASIIAVWPTVPLGEVIRQRKEFIQIDDLAEYKRCRVQLHAQGVVLRDVVVGVEVKTKSQQVCRVGEFLVAEIDAKVGGFGLVPDGLEGAIASSHYFLFAIDATRLDRKFLGYYIRTHDFMDQVRAQGSTNYAAVRPANVLCYTIPLPPLVEQRRIVARIEALAARIEQARGLRREALAEVEAIVPSLADQLLAQLNALQSPLSSILREDSLNGLSAHPSDVPPGTPILRISAGTTRADAVVDEGDFKYLAIDGATVSKYALMPGDLLACRFNGNLANVGKFSIYHGYSGVTQVYPDKLIRFRIDEGRAIPAYVRIAMNSRRIRESIERFCATTAGNIGISASNLKTICIPLPTLAEQQSIVTNVDTIFARTNTMRRLLSDTAAELDTLLPSILDKAFRGEL